MRFKPCIIKMRNPVMRFLWCKSKDLDWLHRLSSYSVWCVSIFQLSVDYSVTKWKLIGWSFSSVDITMRSVMRIWAISVADYNPASTFLHLWDSRSPCSFHCQREWEEHSKTQGCWKSRRSVSLFLCQAGTLLFLNQDYIVSEHSCS